MIAAVADTHAALWLLFGDPRLSPAARAVFDEAARDRRKVLWPRLVWRRWFT